MPRTGKLVGQALPLRSRAPDESDFQHLLEGRLGRLVAQRSTVSTSGLLLGLTESGCGDTRKLSSPKRPAGMT